MSATIAKDEGPAGLSTRTIPVGSSPRGGKEPASHEVCDLLDRGLAREARRLTVPTPTRLARDRGHVQLVDACAQADTPRRAVLSRRLADQYRHIGALDRAQVIDDPLR